MPSQFTNSTITAAAASIAKIYHRQQLLQQQQQYYSVSRELSTHKVILQKGQFTKRERGGEKKKTKQKKTASHPDHRTKRLTKKKNPKKLMRTRKT